MRLRIVWGVAVALLAVARPVAAFWPFTREIHVILPDSTTRAHIETRYEAWKEGREAGIDSVLAATPGTQPPPAGGAAPGEPTRYGVTGEALPTSPPVAPTAPPAAGSGGTGTATVDSSGAGSAATGSGEPGGGNPLGTSVPDSTTGGGETAGSAFGSQPPAGPSGLAPGDSTGAASVIGAGPDSTARRPSGPFPGLTGATGVTNGISPEAAAAAALARGFAPDFHSALGSTNDYMRLTSDMSIRLDDPTGILLATTLSYGADLSLTQNTDQRTSGLVNSFSAPLFRRALMFNLSTTNTRMTKQGSRNVSNTSTNDFSDTRGAEASFAGSRRLENLPGLGRVRGVVRGWGGNLFYARRVGSSTMSTVATQGAGVGETHHSDTGNSYGVGINFDRFKWMVVRTRAGTSRHDNLDRLSIDQKEDLDSESQGDTATVDVDIPKLRVLPKLVVLQNVKLSFRAAEGNDTSINLARNQFGTQTGGVGNYVLDTHSSLRNIVSVSGLCRFKRLEVNLSGNAGRNYDSYEIRANSFNDTRRYGWSVQSKLDFWKGATLTANYEGNIADVNQDENGIPNPSTRRDQGNKLYLEATKGFTPTLRVKAFGEFQLDRSFYDNAGPQGKADRDELRQRVGMEFSGAIGTTIKAQATLYVRTYDQAFIDPRQSARSRNETEYIVRPSYSWQITPRVVLRQSFGLASKVLEQIFDHDRDTLNRNHYMRTEMEAHMSQRLNMNLNWDYRLQDNGRYFGESGSPERFFSPTARTKNDGIGVGMRYAVIRGDKLTFASRQESQRVYNFSFVDGEPKLRSVADSGNLSMGFESRLQLADLQLDCHVYRNRSFNVSLNRDVYYNVDATLSYTF